MHEIFHIIIKNSCHMKSLEEENIIYRMLGNGGNEFFNEFYRIPINEEVERLTK